MGRAVSGLDGQVLELPFKNPEIQPIPSALVSGGEAWSPTQILLLHVYALSSDGTTLMTMVTAMTIGPRFSTGRVLHLPAGIDAWSCLSFVCFRASWPIDCCTCSGLELARSVVSPLSAGPHYSES